MNFTQVFGLGLFCDARDQSQSFMHGREDSASELHMRPHFSISASPELVFLKDCLQKGFFVENLLNPWMSTLNLILWVGSVTGSDF